MRRLAQVSFIMFSCAYSTQLQAVPDADTKPASGALSPKDRGYIEEDPVVARLIGKPAPALLLKTIDGRSINLSDFYGKRPVYLKLWATYCIPCRVQMPGLKKIFASHGDKMAIIAVDAGIGDDIDKVKEFVHDVDLQMPVAVDDGRLGAWIGMRATPVHLVIGRDGRVIFAGHQDGEALDAAIALASATAGSPARVATTRLADLVTLKAGDVVPAITLGTSDGRDVVLPHGSNARPRAIYFSATWCESYMKMTQPTEAERCKIGREQVAQLASDQRIEWFGVMTQLFTTPKALGNYEAKTKPPFPQALDTSGAAFRTFRVKRWPAVALIDTHGRLIKVVEGDPLQFETAICSLRTSK